MLAGGADAAIIPSGIGGFIACKALSRRNEDPASASRPWDRDRDGFVMGEGAGAHRPFLAYLASHLKLEAVFFWRWNCKASTCQGSVKWHWCFSSRLSEQAVL
jgi:hypothetical protein